MAAVCFAVSVYTLTILQQDASNGQCKASGNGDGILYAHAGAMVGTPTAAKIKPAELGGDGSLIRAAD